MNPSNKLAGKHPQKLWRELFALYQCPRSSFQLEKLGMNVDAINELKKRFGLSIHAKTLAAGGTEYRLDDESRAKARQLLGSGFVGELKRHTALSKIL